MTKLVASVLLCGLYAGCAVTGWRQTAPHNTPFAWEFNAPMEGWRSLYAGWKQLTAPEGMIWDDLMGSYQQDLGGVR